MRLILIAREKELADTLRWQFRPHSEVEVVHGAFEDLEFFDCIATAGNSFGLMDAGIDRAIVKFFGEGLMVGIQQRILDEFLGEQPVGTCFVFPTGHVRHPFVAHAPTMRIPMNISGTDYVYLAMWATLLAVRRHNRTEPTKINTLVCPAFGTGSGGVDFVEASLQLRLAYEHYQATQTYKPVVRPVEAGTHPLRRKVGIWKQEARGRILVSPQITPMGANERNRGISPRLSALSAVKDRKSEARRRGVCAGAT